MELDERILKGKRPLSPFDTEEAKKFIGKQCYFTNDITSFAYLDSLNKGELTSVGDDEINSYKHIGERSSYATNFILPCEWVQKKEKKYRPYTLTEFTEKFKVGLPIKFRRKGMEGCERYLILNGYQHEQYNGQAFTYIYIGQGTYNLQELFNAYEWQEHYTEDFEPFGVEE